jgi:NAD-dependent dihydropyrimidine dehydrogenase PreA subunit
VAAACLTAILLAVVQVKVRRPMLLAERFFPGGGVVEIVLLALYAGWLTGRLLPPRQTPVWRSRLWTLFSAVFFGQFLLGVAGLERFLMTGTLHLPVPALIVGGPLYRGEGFFMPILFGATLLVVGPAWCSYLCYIGAWDNGLSRSARKAPLPQLARQGGGWRRWVRPANLLLVVAASLLLRQLGAPGRWAALLGALFGLGGVLVMLIWSRRTGIMAHCSWYCPIGFLASRIGRFLPFRLRVADSCTSCGLCTLACRYDALTPVDVASGRPGWSCTLCGDCLGACRHGSLGYSFWRWGGVAREAFLVLVVSGHAVFLGVARL